MLQDTLAALRKQAPLIHCITNYVTANDCANLLLACGASPIMADDPAEAAEITAQSQGLLLNLGTLNQRTIPAMLAAGRQANALGLPVVLDPVGAGASRLRSETAAMLLSELRFAAIRGNSSEIKALATGSSATRGVDAALSDQAPEDTLGFAQEASRRWGAVVALTGPIDIVAHGTQACLIQNGHPMMGRVTGTGCQLSALTAAFLAANPSAPLEAVSAAVCAMGLCGEIAHRRLGRLEGNIAYRGRIIDALYRLTPEHLAAGAKARFLPPQST